MNPRYRYFMSHPDFCKQYTWYFVLLLFPSFFKGCTQMEVTKDTQRAVHVCAYCNQEFEESKQVIEHCIKVHPNEKISFATRNNRGDSTSLRKRTYQISGSDIETNSDGYTFDAISGKFAYRKIIVKDNTDDVPPSKACRIDNIGDDTTHTKIATDINIQTVKKDENYVNCNEEHSANLYSQSFQHSYMGNENDASVQSAVEEISKLLISVTNKFAECNRLKDWVNLFVLINSGVLSPQHIAVQLFFDVVRFGSKGDIRAMRYTPEVKRFRSVGHSLFKSKFLRFMGGYKSFSGVDICDEKVDLTSVNFVCPDKKLLTEEKRRFSIDCSTPGIIYSNIRTVAETKNASDKCYCLSIDGKKIASGFGRKLGDVDLFGHESEPTHKMLKDRLGIEKRVVDNAFQIVKHHLDQEKGTLDDFEPDSKRVLSENVINILSINTERLKEMRTLKVSKQLLADKLMKMAPGPWQKSKYSFAISNVKTQLYDLNGCIKDILKVNTELGLIASGCKGSESSYSLEDVIDLSVQENFQCINPTNKSTPDISTRFIKQRTKQWETDRSGAKVTGSSIYSALGLSSLKDQQQHFERVIMGSTTHSSSAPNGNSEALHHGVVNEINAVGTLLSRILPIFLPYSIFCEEGYYKIRNGEDNTFLIVSPDGSCRTDNAVECGIEIKCPLPNKHFTTDVHYQVPKRYVTQLLSEMAALGCKQLLYATWTPESTTVMKALFDENLWERIIAELSDLYGQNHTKAKPSKKRPVVENLLQDIQNYARNSVTLLCEIESVLSVPCVHSVEEESQKRVMLTHGEKTAVNVKTKQVNEAKKKCFTAISMSSALLKAKSCLDRVYNILRVPAKEVLVAVISDFDRCGTNDAVHGVPVAYGLSGYSLKTDCMRSFIHDIILQCKINGIDITSISTDGQFYRLAVRDKDENPLTILQLAKQTWERVKKMKKSEQVKKLCSMNLTEVDNYRSTRDAIDCNLLSRKTIHGNNGPIYVNGWKNTPWPTLYNPRKLKELLNVKPTVKSHLLTLTNIDLQNMPVDAANTIANEECDSFTDNHKLDTMVIHEATTIDDQANGDRNNLLQVDSDLTSSPLSVKHNNEHINLSSDENVRVTELSGTVLHDILCELKQLDERRKKAKWCHIDEMVLQNKLKSDAVVLNKLFTKDEILVCAKHFQHSIERSTNKTLKQMSKYELANAFSHAVGKSQNLIKKKSPPSLKIILKDLLSKSFGKEALNAILATDQFLQHDLPNWRQKAIFKDGVCIGRSDSSYVWYSQPEYIESVGEHVTYLLDTHHLFVNARSKVCQSGISGLNVKRDAWISLASLEAGKECGLNKAIVEDIVDKQSNAMAQLCFSEKVEEALNTNGWKSEAKFCKIIREWYRAEDEAGLDVETRYKYRMNMRQLLLNAVNLADFPPPGLNISGIPTVMFEGILTNIDRRYQLHAMVPGNAYNVRAPNTLVVEKLFGGFQDLDPKSSGVLLADDIPYAIETASYLIQSKLDPERPFEMRTTQSSRLYPIRPLQKEANADFAGSYHHMKTDFGSYTRIPVQSHAFDSPSRAKRKPKRKKACIPDYRNPSLGTQPVRQYHKADSSKILPHVRHGLYMDTT